MMFIGKRQGQSIHEIRARRHYQAEGQAEGRHRVIAGNDLVFPVTVLLELIGAGWLSPATRVPASFTR